jgi:3-isopropylmalate/(R)-2-methylmalate dehydratase small subunit
MEPLIQLNAIGAPLRLANVNTDQLFPARFIKKPRAVGYAQYLFHDIRRTDAGDINPSFSLNKPKFASAKILFTGSNFGSGSSREGAVYALYDSGFRAVFAPSFGEIFAANCLKNGVLTARLDQEMIQSIQEELDHAQEPRVSIDIDQKHITLPTGQVVKFNLDPFQKHCLMNGLNEIDLSLEFHDEITTFEENHRKTYPWTAL